MAECDRKTIESAAEALRILFGDAAASARSPYAQFRKPLEDMLYRALYCLAAPEDPIACAEVLNELVRLTPHRGLIEALEDEFFEMLIANQLDITKLLKPHTMDFEQIEFYRKNFLDLEQGIAELRKNLDSPRINPAVKACLAGKSVLSESAEKIVTIALMRDPFAQSRTFRYIKGKFTPCSVKNIPVKKFYGFHSVRDRFSEHLSDFASNRGNVPLLVSSLPGLGKTQFSINYTLNSPELTLIFAEPETLSQDLEELIALLALRKRRKFVVFFDDIEPENIDWYNFRTNVGGSAVLPENIIFILASNYHFPSNILSRGREITFPVFDEIRCLEMVEDFLIDFGMKNTDENLASVIAAGYIEDFGQKKFTELSPRTLIRYLERFRTDAALRRKMLDMSHQEMIVRPDAQLFYEFNIKLLRTLYGESYIDALREEKLRELGA